MNIEEQGERLPPKLPVVAIVLGTITAFVIAGAVSWSTPDGNLVVTLVPALAVGLTVFGLALRRFRRGGSKCGSERTSNRQDSAKSGRLRFSASRPDRFFSALQPAPYF